MLTSANSGNYNRKNGNNDMKLYQRWKQTSLPNKLLIGTGFLVAFGTLFYAVAAVFQVYVMKESSQQTAEQNERLITKIKEMADSMKTSLEQTAGQSKVALDTTIANARWINGLGYRFLKCAFKTK